MQFSQSPETVLTITSFVISVDPKISVIPEFLSPQECEHLINLAEENTFCRSLVGRGKYSHNLPDPSAQLENQYSVNRTSMSVTLQPFQDAALALIEHRLAGLVNMKVEHLESLVVVKYEAGQYFKQHLDGIFRAYTVFIYLNDLPDNGGGETYFPIVGLRIKPRVGTALVWRNSFRDENGNLVEDERLQHEGKPTVGCTKYGVNCFFNYNCMR